jgi:hypothetical protein
MVSIAQPFTAGIKCGHELSPRAFTPFFNVLWAFFNPGVEIPG